MLPLPGTAVAFDQHSTNQTPMKLLHSLRQWLVPHPQPKAFAPTLAAWLRGDGAEPAGALVNAYQQSSWVYAAITAKAIKLAQTPLKLYRGETPAHQGPAGQLLQHPHPHLDRFAFWELVVTWLDLRGEVFLVPLDRHGAVTALRPGAEIHRLLLLPPDQFTEIIEHHSLAGWRYAATGAADPLEGMLLLPEEVLHWRLPHPFHPWRGLSPLAAAQLAAQTDYHAAQFMKGLILNNADTGLIVTTDQHLSQAQMDQVQAALRERKARAGQADRPLFLSGGVKVEKPALNVADLQFLENRKFNRQEILAVFRVPETILGFTEDANRAVAEAQMLHWIHHVLAPLCRRLEAGLQPLLDALEPRAGLSACFDLEDLPELQDARRGRVDAAHTLFHLGVPLNDINRVLDLGLPAYPWGDQPYLPQNVKPLPPPAP